VNNLNSSRRDNRFALSFRPAKLLRHISVTNRFGVVFFALRRSTAVGGSPQKKWIGASVYYVSISR
jgi:hypothetical protein